MWKRVKVLGIGLVLGGMFALWVAGPMIGSHVPIAGRLNVWASVMGGPIMGTAWGMGRYVPAINFGWLGLLLVPWHPIRPSVGTGLLTAVGLLLWFFAGFAAIAVAFWA